MQKLTGKAFASSAFDGCVGEKTLTVRQSSFMGWFSLVAKRNHVSFKKFENTFLSCNTYTHMHAIRLKVVRGGNWQNNF